MCYLLIAIGQSADYPFVLAANRDEFYQRGTAQAEFWMDQPHILGGRDLEQGGTWMAVSNQGKFAALTNFRQSGHAESSSRSRGLLITDFLDPEMDIDAYSQNLLETASDYNGFNLVYGTLPNTLHYFSNRSNRPVHKLEPGIYALSNHLLDTAWPKVVRGKKMFSQIIATPDNMAQMLFKLLSDPTPAQHSELPDTGIEKDLEHMLSSIFIHSEQYGTRCSSVITVDNDRQLNFRELTYDNGPEPLVPRKEFSFALNS